MHYEKNHKTNVPKGMCIMTQNIIEVKDKDGELFRNFKGIWIERRIWLAKDIGMTAKTMWAEIDSLYDEESGGCFASDIYLMTFLGIKKSRLQEVLKELRDNGYLEKVSFDGKFRVMKAVIPEKTFVKPGNKKGGFGQPKSKKTEVKTSENSGFEVPGKPGSCHPENRVAATRKTGELSIYIYKSIDKSLETSSTSPRIPVPIRTPIQPAEASIAIAQEIGLNLSKSDKKIRAPIVFSEKVIEVTKKLIEILKEQNPVYRPPQNLTKFLTQVHYLIDKDKQDTDELIKIFKWAASDNEKRGTFHGWQGVLCCANPAEMLRKHFSKIASQSKSKAKRVLSPSSNDEASLEKWKEKEKEAI